MDAAEFSELKKKLWNEYQEKLRALELVYGFAKTKAPRVSSAARHVTVKQEPSMIGRGSVQGGDLSSSQDGEARGVVLHAARSAVDALEGHFTWSTLKSKMEEMSPGKMFVTTSVRQAIGRLAELNEIALVERGTGRNPSQYKKATA
jgi:hypothetical protein